MGPNEARLKTASLRTSQGPGHLRQEEPPSPTLFQNGLGSGQAYQQRCQAPSAESRPEASDAQRQVHPPAHTLPSDTTVLPGEASKPKVRGVTLPAAHPLFLEQLPGLM